MKTKFYNTFFIFLLISGFGFAQNESEFWKHTRFGGTAGLSFSNMYFQASLQPSAIYDFNRYFSAGVGAYFSYLSEKDVQKSTILGPSVIALANPTDYLQISAELLPLYINTKYDDRFLIEDEGYWNTSLFIGLGYTTGPVTFGIQYNVLYKEDESIYSTPYMPFVRVYL